MIPAALGEGVALAGFAGVLLCAAASDIRQLRIPNDFCVTIAALWPVYALAVWLGGGHPDWLGAPAVAAVLLAVGFLAYAKGWFGAGDVKLLAVVGLWAGPALVADFLLITGLTGGVMALAVMLVSGLARASLAIPRFGPWVPNALVDLRARPLPYAVPIAAGGMLVVWSHAAKLSGG